MRTYHLFRRITPQCEWQHHISMDCSSEIGRVVCEGVAARSHWEVIVLSHDVDDFASPHVWVTIHADAPWGTDQWLNLYCVICNCIGYQGCSATLATRLAVAVLSSATLDVLSNRSAKGE